MNKFFKNWHFAAVLFSGLFVYNPLHAQSFINASSVDLYDTQAQLINPGVLKFQDGQLAVGSRVLHYGFVDNNSMGLTNSYVSVTLPDVTKLKLGLGLFGTILNTPFYSENKANFLIGMKFSENFGFGTQFGLLTKSFNRDEFILVDPGDPVFKDGTSTFAFNFGFGAYWRAKPQLHFGLAIENFNRPNISLINDPVYQSRVMHFTANYLYAGLEFDSGFILEGKRLFPGVGVSSTYQGIGTLKLGLLAGNLDITGQMHITEKISFDYKYSYPLSPVDAFSNGSHRVSLIYRLGDTPNVDFEVFATVDSQRIAEERIFKNIDEKMAPSAIVKYDFVHKLKSANDPVHSYYKFVPVGQVSPLPKIDFDPFLNKYLEQSTFLGQRLQADSELKLRIIVAQDSEKYQRLARSYSDYFQENFDIRSSQLEYGYALFDTVVAANSKHSENPYYQSNKITNQITHFVIKPIISRKYNRVSGIRQWALLIKDSQGKLVKKFQGNNEPPEVVSWDWRTDDDAIVGVGKYRYFLEWKDKKNQVQHSAERILEVTKTIREISVNFTKQKQQNEEKHLRIDWLLGK